MAGGKVVWRDRKGRRCAAGKGRPYADFSIGGKRHRVRLDGASTITEAKVALARVMADASRESKAIPRRSKSPPSLGEAIALYLDSSSCKLTDRGRYTTKRQLLAFAAIVGEGKRLDELATDVVSEWVRYREDVDRVKASTIRRNAMAASGLFQWAMSPGRRWMKENPIRGFRLPTHGAREPRTGLSSWNEVRQVLDALAAEDAEHARLYPAFMLAYLMGVTRQEAADALWRHVDLEARTMLIPMGKVESRIATIPVHPRFLEWAMGVNDRRGRLLRGHYGTGASPYTGQFLERARVQWNKRADRDQHEVRLGAGSPREESARLWRPGQESKELRRKA